jgi:hypothetical protein
MSKGKSPLEPLTESEILDAVGASGYPLEIRLLKAFTDGGMDPTIGFRVSSAPGESREIDILASLIEHVAPGNGKLINITLRLVIEAKSLEPGAAFIGFPWNRPTPHEMRVHRMHFGGLPSNRVIRELRRDSDAINGAGGLSEAFDALNVAPVCVQWSVARRTKQGGGEQRPIATHDDPFWKGLDGTVRAAHALMHEHSTYKWSPTNYLVIFELPVLAIATPGLWLLDATNPSHSPPLRQTQHLILGRMFQLEEHVEYRFVDVVTEGGVPALIAGCKSVITELKLRVAANAEALMSIGDQQRADLDMLRLERLVAEREL